MTQTLAFPSLSEVPLRALSVVQPWGHAIASLGKPLENRDRWSNSAYRGPVLIHASQSVGSRDDFDSAVDSVLYALRRAGRPASVRGFAVEGRLRGDPIWLPAAELPLGGIVGVATVVGVVRRGRAVIGPVRLRYEDPEPITRALSSVEEAWWAEGFALVLEDARPVPYVACKGALGFWEVPLAVRRALCEAA